MTPLRGALSGNTVLSMLAAALQRGDAIAAALNGFCRATAAEAKPNGSGEFVG